MAKDAPMTASERQRRTKIIAPRQHGKRQRKNPIEPSPPDNSPSKSNESENSRPEVMVRSLGEGSSSGTDRLDNEDDGGPVDKSVLLSFESHIAHAIWRGIEGKRKFPLKTIMHFPKMNGWDLREEVSGVQSRVARCGLLNLVDYGFQYIDYIAVSAFVERWQPETNTFHLPFGEMTITLDDVRNILGVPVDGNCVNSVEGGREIAPDQALNLLVDLLGIDIEVAKTEMKRSYAVRLDWLKRLFKKKAKEDSSEDYLDKCARAYILYILGCVVFPDKTKSSISVFYLGCFRDLDKVGEFSWGTAILGHLYRQLGLASRAEVKQIAGSLSLLVAWIYDHFPGCVGAIPDMEYTELQPRLAKWTTQQCVGNKSSSLKLLREQLDDLTEKDVCWDPYRDHRDAHPLHEISFFCGLLVCFDLAEPYYPDRVLRQFGRVQTIPSSPMMVAVKLKRGKKSGGYKVVYNVTHWLEQNWRNHLLNPQLQSVPAKRPWDCSEDYLEWFLRITHPIIQAPRLRKTAKRISGEADKEILRLKLEMSKAKAVLLRSKNEGSTDLKFVIDEALDILARATATDEEDIEESELRRKKREDPSSTRRTPKKGKAPAKKRTKK